jgi:hypothetical protein
MPRCCCETVSAANLHNRAQLSVGTEREREREREREKKRVRERGRERERDKEKERERERNEGFLCVRKVLLHISLLEK